MHFPPRWRAALLLLLPCLASVSGAVQPLATWCYRDLTGLQDEREAFFRFAQARGVGSLFLGAGDLLPGREGPLAAFLQEAGARGLEVHLAMGHDDWFLPEHRAEAMEQVKAAAAFARARRAEGRGLPASLQLDVEPQALPRWPKDKALLAAQFLDFLEAVKAELGDALPLTVDIPVWWNRVQVRRGSVSRSLSAWVLVIADGAVLMDYRNTLPAILRGARADLALAAALGRQVVVGLDIHCDGEPETRTTSFCGKGAGALEKALGAVDRRLRGRRGFGGLAVFTYEDWSGWQQREVGR